MNTITRQPQDGPYHFIKRSTLECRTTTDLHFESDDEKWEAGNYFISKEKADDCADQLQAEYADRLEDLTHRRNRNRDKLCTALSKLYEDMDKGTPVEEWDREDLEKAVALVKLSVKAFNTERQMLGSEFSQIQKEITEIITNYPKI